MSHVASSTVAWLIESGGLVAVSTHVAVRHVEGCDAMVSVTSLRRPGERCATCGALFTRVLVLDPDRFGVTW